MKAEDYREIRKGIGSQEHVAALLDVTRETINKRESGKGPIGQEAAMAILWLARAKQEYGVRYEEVARNPQATAEA